MHPVPATEDHIVAAIIDAPGSTPRVGLIEPGDRGPRTTRIRVVAAPLNPLDLLIASGSFHSVRHELPYVPGSECVGVVLESETYAVGAWVYAECHAAPKTPGTLASQVVVDDASTLPLPPGLDAVLAAAVGNAGTAAYMPLVEEAGLVEGENVLVLGATGAVGQIAVQLAKARGAARVVGVARNPAALERLLGEGADAVVAVGEADTVDQLAARIGAAIGTADVILDGLFGPPLEAALRICAPHARVVNIGNLAGATAAIPAGLLRGRQITLSGFAGLHISLGQKRAALTWLWKALGSGELSVPVRTFTLDEVPDAWRVQASSPHGKCVVTPHGGGSVRTPAEDGTALTGSGIR